MHTGPTRRAFLKGAAGVTFPLPFLASLQPGCANETAPFGNPLVVLRCASGVAQREDALGLPEMWWPRRLGGLSHSSLSLENFDRATSELAHHAQDLTIVRGTSFPFEATREVHAGGGNQLLTGARPGPLTDTVMTFAQGESIDNWIARQYPGVNGGEPLTLYAGRRTGYGEEVLSYRGPNQLRAAESEPWAVYLRMIGADSLPELRDSVNDLVLDQLRDLRGHRRLSAFDRDRLDQHTDAVRDFEVLCDTLPSSVENDMEDLYGRSADDSVSLDVARLHCDLIALVLACGQARAVTLQIGDRLDRAYYTFNGFYMPQYHELTHGLADPDQFGPYRSTHEMHADVNRLHLRVYTYLLDRLRERELLQNSVALFCSDLATGSHTYVNLPFIVAGNGDGSVKTGQYIDAGNVTHDHLLASLLNATGHRRPDGDLIRRFGDESLPGGLIRDLIKT